MRYIRVGRRKSAIESRRKIRQANLNGYLGLSDLCGKMYGVAYSKVPSILGPDDHQTKQGNLRHQQASSCLSLGQFPMGTGVKRPGREADHSHPASAEVKKM
jgi:hypothetical protein